VIEFLPVRSDQAALARYGELFAACFSRQPRFGTEVLRWLYAANPDGHVVGFDAWDGGQLAAHYVCIPVRLVVDGVAERGLLSLNTATHPKWQGQGLFTRLANRTYEAAARDGYGSIYGVANANSTHGFVRKLGFQLVRPLRAMVGVGSLRFDVPSAIALAGFSRLWSPEALAWRCANPVNTVSMRRGRGGERWFFARGPAPLAPAYAELPPGDGQEAARTPAAPARLYLGLAPSAAGGLGRYVDIPNALRPSPLNFIYKDLTGRQRQLDPDSAFFSFLDFDAY